MAVRARRALLAQVRHPTPDRDGGSSRTLDLAAALQGMGFQVTFCAVAPEEGWERYARLLGQQGIEVRNGMDAVTEDLRRGAFEVAAMTFWPTAEVVAPIVAELAPGTPIVVHSGDLHFLRMARRAAVAGAPVEDETGRDFAREVNAYLLADRVIMVSEEEARLAAQLLGDDGRFVVAPLSEPAAAPPLPLHERSGLLLAGNFRHIPNLEAAQYLCDVVLAHVDRRLLDRHPLTVVGNGLDERWYSEIKDSISRFPGVRLAGWVPDVGPYVRRTRVSVAPLLHGAGVKGKILASLAAGTPVVTTHVGIEGLEARVAAAVCLADGAFGLAAAIEQLLADDALWTSTAGAGPTAVASVHARPVVLQRLRTIIGEAMAAAGRPRTRLQPMTSFAEGSHRQADRQRADVLGRLPGTAEAVTSEGDEVLVVTGGDDRLLSVPRRSTRAFPVVDEPELPGSVPVSGAAAVSHLRALVDRGATHLVLPAMSLSWLHRYPELGRFLDDGGTLVHRSELGRIYRLPPIAPQRGRIVAAVPEAIAEQLKVAPPVTCEVEARPWSGKGPPPLADVAGDVLLLVGVRPGTRLPPGFWDGLAAAADELSFDVLQPALAVGSGAPPAYEAQGGVVARAMPLLAAAPVVAARPPAAPWLIAALASEEGAVPDPGTVTTAVLDATPVGVDPAPSQGFSGRSPATLRLDAIVSRSRGLQPVPGRHPRPRISIVIATYRRPDLLALCLESFASQDAEPDSFEVVVVDDGSGDPSTFQLIDRFRERLAITALGINHAGRSAAKNIGILAAQGDLVLLVDDDDVATPGLIDVHLAKHRDHPEPELAILGQTTWAPDLPVSPVMHYVTEVGMLLFSYGKISAGQLLDYRHFWEGRISCKRAFLLANGLHDQRLAYTIDIELGHRLAGAGLKVVYAPEAMSHMARAVTSTDFAQRCVAKGRAARELSQLHPSPGVREYCHIDDAEATYPALAATLEDDLARLYELERLAGPLWATAPADVVEPLHQVYGRVFKACTYQGTVEAGERQPGWPTLSIVIAVWSVTEDLAAVAYRTVERLWEVARVPTEVIVVDNGSPRRADLRATKVITWPDNRGVAPAWNSGLGAARGDVLAVLNSDVVVEPGWDEAQVEAASSGRRIAFPYTDHCDGLGPRRPDKAGTAGWCFALSPDLFAELGPFDERFAPAYWEDTDYWHRAHLAGVALTPVPAARVQHARRTTARHLEGFDELFERNRRRYEDKHGMERDEAPPYWHREIKDHVPGQA